MFAIFKKNPTRQNLEMIIKEASNILTNVEANSNGKGISITSAHSYSNWWVSANSTPNNTNKSVINDYFEQILNDINQFKTYPFQHEEVRQIYQNLIEIYYEKVINVYQFE
jgi:hypothetical protein